jgi:GTP pyrophosphokinase
MIAMQESRVRHLQTTLSILGYYKSLKALEFVMAEMCSEKGYSRHNGTHYYYHLVDTAQDLINHGVRDDDIISACLLHDTIEDIEGVTHFMLAREYDGRVADMVQLVTKNPTIDYKNNRDEMVKYLTVISENVGSALIKTADRKHNFGTLRDATPEKKMRQAKETRELFIPFFKECRNRYPVYSSYFFSAKTTIEPHLNEIEEHYQEVAELQRMIDELKSDNQRLETELMMVR